MRLRVSAVPYSWDCPVIYNSNGLVRISIVLSTWVRISYYGFTPRTEIMVVSGSNLKSLSKTNKGDMFMMFNSSLEIAEIAYKREGIVIV